jgi:hypothetical protein
MVCYQINLLLLGTMERHRNYLERGMDEENTSPSIQAKPEAHSILNLSPTWSSGPGYLKNID